jgi:hypothetical protein
LLTKHHKLPLIAPALAELGITLELTDNFDTDSLGSFSGEVVRLQSPLDCVKTKAKLACELTGLAIGIGSEGSFGGGPLPGLLNWDDELLCLFNQNTGQWIIAHAAGAVPLSSIQSNQVDVIRAHIDKQDSAQGWICTYRTEIIKGLVGADTVIDALQQAGLLLSATELADTITLSPDLRAHLCPSRQVYIRQAAAQLATRLRSFCPCCQAPNFWRNDAERGLRCATCDSPTQRVLRYIKKCDCCGYTEYEEAATPVADPAYCPLCNP